MNHHRWHPVVAAALAAALAAAAAAKPVGADPATLQLGHDIFRELIETNTTDSTGSTTVAAAAMAQRLRDGGFAAGDISLLGPNPRKGNLVVRYRGKARTARKPMLIIGHLDVVEARREDWSTDPFQFVEKDGYYYGRGTQDMKISDAIIVTDFIRLRKEGYVPDRDIILALTADEEGGDSNGVDWLLKNHRELIDAEYVLNPDGGGVFTDPARPSRSRSRPPKSSMPISRSWRPTAADTARCRRLTIRSIAWPARSARWRRARFRSS